MAGPTPPTPVPTQTAYQPKDQQMADTFAVGNIQNAATLPNAPQSIYSWISPQVGDMISGKSGYDPSATVTAGNNLSAAGQPALDYASWLMKQGQDPQNDLYNRNAQRQLDQIRAGQSARGIAMSPYGAGLEAQGMENFNLDWADRALGRGVQAASGAAPLLQRGAQDIVQGQQLAQSVPGQQLSWADTLANIGNKQYAGPQLIDQLTQNYLRTGQNATSTTNNAITSMNAANQTSWADQYKQYSDIMKAFGNATSFIF